MKNLRRQVEKSFILQRDQSDCGVACLCSIIKFHGGEGNIENLRRLSGTSKQGTTLLGLMQAAKNEGFEAEGLEAESVHNLIELTEPAILHVTVENSLQHYLVYYPSEIPSGVAESKFVLGDPAHGIISMTLSELDTIWKSKAVLKLSPTEKFAKKSKIKRRKQAWIIDLIKKDLLIFLISILLGIAISLLGICTAVFSQKLVDEILPNQDVQKLFIGLALVSAILLVRSCFAYLRGYFMIQQSKDFNNRIIRDFYHNLLHLPKLFFDTRKTGELIARMNDTRRIQSVLSLLLGSIVIDVLMVIISLVFVYTYSAIIGHLILACIPIYYLILKIFNQPVNQSQREVMAGYATTESNFIDTIQGIADIKLLNKQTFFENVNAEVFGAFQQRLKKLGKLSIELVWSTEVVGIFFSMAVFGLSSWLVLLHDLKLGEMVSLLAISSSILPSMNRLVAANIQIQEGKVAFERMFEFASIPSEQSVNQITNTTLLKRINTLNIHNISFRFAGRKEVLSNVTLTIKKGEIVALLGESGGGKSTLLQLLQRFYQPERGSIKVDDINIEQVELQSWRALVGSVPQELKIFNGSLLYNITLSVEQEVNKKAIDFCNEHGFGKYFLEFPQGYGTLIGEEGVNISGGQKQLVVLARALFYKPQILLLDEATSSLDSNTENFVLELLKELNEQMIILLVTHRINTAERCDKAYQLVNGSTFLYSSHS